MTKAAFIKRNGALWPMDDDGREIVAAMPNDKQVMVNVHAPRNPRHHRLLFHLLNRVIKGGAWSGDTDTLLDYLKFSTGLVRTTVNHRGEAVYVPKSIAFEAMPQDRFSAWFDRCCWIICSRLLEREDWEWLRDEIGEAVDGDLTERARAA